jgi:hypothetical protein
MHSAPPAPIFTSTPGSAASEGVVYSCQLAATDPAGGTVEFSLTAVPTTATLTGNALSWTPAPSQSPVSNSFTVAATTASGGNATQSWKVAPTGTITVNWINSLWGSTGQTPGPIGPLASVLALVPQPDGSLLSIPGALKSRDSGVFDIPNVPAGYYWLLLTPVPIVPPIGFWTSSSTFDSGRDEAGSPPPFTANSQTTTFNFNLAGLEPAPATSWVAFVTDNLGIPPFFFSSPSGSTTLNATLSSTDRVDWSKVNTAFLMQLEPVSLSMGSLNFLALGPGLSLTNLSLTSGTTNTIDGTLQTSPQTSINLDVPGSQWAPLFQNAGPTAATVQSAWLSIQPEPYVSGSNANASVLGPNLFMVSPNPGAAPPSPFSGCVNLPFFLPPLGILPILTDQDFGTLQYGDPFPSSWTRVLAFCQGAIVIEPLPGGGIFNSYPIPIMDGEVIAPSSSPLAPVASQVQSPTVNGASLFTQSTINATAVTLAWSAPATGTPYGYTVLVLQVLLINQGVELLQTGTYSTAKTSITLPPQAAGNDYLSLITAQVDGIANMETGPYRSALPTGYATVVSAPIPIASGATAPAIRGAVKAFAELSRRRMKMPTAGFPSQPAPHLH